MRPHSDIKVAAFTKYDREAASTRQRVLQYLPCLAQAGIKVDVFPLLDDSYVRALATDTSSSKTTIVTAYFRRMRQLRDLGSVDLIWIYAELFPWLPAAFERLAFHPGKPILYDFDDAFFEPYQGHSNALIRSVLGNKLKPLLGGAAAVCAGNAYLKDYADRVGGKAIILPTVVDTDLYVPAATRPDRPLTIGWIGSPSTWNYVRPLLPLLAELCRDGDVRFSVVGAGAGAKAEKFDGMDLQSWSENGEIATVQAMDIGIMPLPDEPWAQGKSGYKLVQYMACGLPVVASPVGANAMIVVDGETGLLAIDLKAWRAALTRMIGDSNLRAAMGRAGRGRAVDYYSLQSHAPRLVEVMRAAVATGRGPR